MEEALCFGHLYNEEAGRWRDDDKSGGGGGGPTPRSKSGMLVKVIKTGVRQCVQWGFSPSQV